MITAVRKIGIDAGHRIPDHESKCKNLHGHRYTVEMHISGEIKPEGSEKGMIKDFSVCKEVMMQTIDRFCDHGLILSLADPFLQDCLVVPKLAGRTWVRLPDVLQFIDNMHLIKNGYWAGKSNVGKLLIMKESPTAENLAALWFRMIEDELHNRGITGAKGTWLTKVVVYETPNCWAEYISQENIKHMPHIHFNFDAQK